jgi:hypothetical protein
MLFPVLEVRVNSDLQMPQILIHLVWDSNAKRATNLADERFREDILNHWRRGSDHWKEKYGS